MLSAAAHPGKENLLGGRSGLPFASITVALTLGQLGPIAQPYEVGALAEAGVMNAGHAAILVGVQMAAYALASMLVARLVGHIGLRSLALAGTILSAAGFAAMSLVSALPALYACAAIAGMGGGLVFGAAVSAAAVTPDPERTMGVACMLALIFYALFMVATPLVQERLGPLAIFDGTALIMIMFAPGLLALPARGSAAGSAGFSLFSARILAFLLMLALFGIATGGIYAFMERFGHALGIAPGANGVILMAGIAAAAFGSAIAGKVGLRFGRMLPLYAAMLVTGIACFAMAGAPVPWVFVVATILFQIFYSLAFPYFIGAASYLEAGGGLASFAGGLVFLTSSIGASAAGVVAVRWGFFALGACSLLACVLGALCIPLFLSRRAVTAADRAYKGGVA